MASIWGSSPLLLLRGKSLSHRSSSLSLSILPHFHADLRASRLQGPRVRRPSAPDPALLRRPVVSHPSPEDWDGSPGERRRPNRRQMEEESEDWEAQILEETVPLVSSVKRILQSRQYESGDRLNPEHEKMIIERLLLFHPEFEKKIGCGIDFITIGYHLEFEKSRCLFIVKKDGELEDFSYWKCIKGLIRKKYPRHADSFILKHFRRHKNAE